MSHRVEHDIDADGVPPGRELIEVPRILSLALPGVGDVGVVRHEHHHVTVAVQDCLVLGDRAVVAALGCVDVVAAPRLDARDLREFTDDELRATLSSKGPVQVAPFTWHAAALTVLDVYRRVAR